MGEIVYVMLSYILAKYRTEQNTVVFRKVLFSETYFMLKTRQHFCQWGKNVIKYLIQNHWQIFYLDLALMFFRTQFISQVILSLK